MVKTKFTGIDTITKRRNLPPRREPYWHKLRAGQYLGLRKSERSETWIVRRSTDGGKKKYYSLGGDLDFERAQDEALAWLKQSEQVEPGQPTRYTVTVAVADYVAHLAIENGEKSSKAVKQSLEKHLVSRLGKVELGRLTTNQIKKWRDGLVKTGDPETVRRSKDTANRVLSIAKAAFNLAFRSGIIGSDTAWRRVPAFKGVGENRKLFLTEGQVQALLEAATGGFRALLQAAVLTGGRYGELVAVKVSDLDLINGALQLDGKTGPRDCYLSDDAMDFLKIQARDRLPQACLFTRDDGTPWGKSHQHRPMKEAVQSAKLPAETVFYSLRHYHISRALLAHIPAQVIAENCGTSIRMLEKHYGKFMATDRRKMMNRVAL
ncbi:MAG: tyrosine-type recombinase/integrase [Gammaproteobacteria bacterium]|nr:tyrosine-type recombinase/integrase [Gammaproteobacteria bacterium]